jgi:hypothetical protein
VPAPGYIISAHGGRWSNQKPDLAVPSTSAVAFYVKDGQLLSNTMGYAILGALTKNQTPPYPVVEQVSGGKTYDYACWYAPQFANYCGIYEVGSTKQVASLKQYTENNPLLLSQILQMYPDCTIYWDACREVSVHAETAVLQNSPGAFPSESPPEALAIP